MISPPLTALLAWPGVALASGPYGNIVVGNWSGAAYTDHFTGKFAYCVASVSYVDGTQLLVSIGTSGSWALGLSHRTWNIQPGMRFPMQLLFDNGRRFNVDGEGRLDNLVFVQMPENSELIYSFRNSQGLKVFVYGRTFVFDLTDSQLVLPALATCVTQGMQGITPNVHLPGTNPASVPPRNPFGDYFGR
jgi:hypothetical protein